MHIRKGEITKRPPRDAIYLPLTVPLKMESLSD